MLNDHNVVQEQYKTGDNLNTRISIHKKYSINKTGFGNWILSHYKLTPDIKILELGCGTGDMWKENLHLLSEGSQLYLTDISEGMVASAKNTLG
ncbi:MAG: methyltransferase domain-containing protein, partial [Ruminiclostridium sp.]|nr:methyltransferase domain-containing protein [Ruminiclostridium sp.]